MTDTPEPTLVDRAELALASITPGVWGDLGEEAERLAVAMQISADEYPDTGSVAWRLITTQGPTDDDWLNLGFMGNGPTSRVNARFCAVAPALIRELVDALRAVGVQS